MALSGIYLASDVVGSVDAAILTVYGRVLVLKVALVGIALLIGGGNHLRMRRRPASPALRVRFVSEAVALTLAFAAAAVLLSGQPATQPQLVGDPTGATVPLISGAVGDLQESVAVRPNLPGPNVVLLQALQTRRPALAPITGVHLTVTAADGSTQQLAADGIGNGQWSVPVTLADSQAIDLTVDVLRQGIAPSSHVYRWHVGSGTAPRHVSVSAAPLRTPLRELAAGLAVAIGLVAVAGSLRRRRAARHHVTDALGAEADAVIRTVAQKAPVDASQRTAR